VRRRRTDPALDDLSRWLEVGGKSPATIRTYVYHVKDFLAFCGHHKTKNADVEAWIMRRGGAPSYVTLRLAAVKSWCRFSKIPDLTEGISRPKPRRGIPRPIRDLDEKLAGMDYRAQLAAVFLSETGLRISEAYALEGSVNGVLHVHGKGGKERLVPLSPKARKALERLKGQMPNSVEWLQIQFREAGISAHALRHTAACAWVAGGADIGAVSKLLGHSSPATTMIYASYSVDRLRETVNSRGAL
jgi:integrase